MLIHCVYFWFKADADPTLVARFPEGLRRLCSIADVQSGQYGPPAATPERAVIDHSYAFGLVATFADIAAHDRYQAHPIHAEFLSEFGSSWERVQVYDLQTQTK